MTTSSLDTQLGLIEQQFNELSAILVDGNPSGVQSASAAMQQLAVDFIQMADEMGRASLASQSRVLRLQTLATTLPILRANLLRRSAYVERALEMVMPATQKTSTYAGSSTYGSAIRQSGAFTSLSA